MRIFLIISTVCLLGLASHAKAISDPPTEEEISTYDQVFMIDTSTEDRELFELGLVGGADIGNPYISGGTLEAFGRIRVYRWVQLGVQYNKYFGSRTTLAQSIEEDLNIQGVVTRFPVAEEALYGQVILQILRGKLNFWGYKKIDLDFLTTLAGGEIKVEGRDPQFSYSWGFTIRMGFTKTFSSLLGITQDIVASENDLSYTRLFGGVSFSF